MDIAYRINGTRQTLKERGIAASPLNLFFRLTNTSTPFQDIISLRMMLLS
ncbi:unnamed protein product [Musa acuminata subsp. malaccensis]|uniref:(wild Malaysian banana) hypothetical protein n=1 Tax=Musa acuminata subsp. malaccensis TaxID=214687 RepID=A0A804KUH8_MUSAM|nr:unnamed protein product [Musa acuminata subsp. malaccensis]CAG1853056.1 unnamed protein product [Musa acuminata subsp. malaccensis]